MHDLICIDAETRRGVVVHTAGHEECWAGGDGSHLMAISREGSAMMGNSMVTCVHRQQTSGTAGHKAQVLTYPDPTTEAFES